MFLYIWSIAPMYPHAQRLYGNRTKRELNMGIISGAVSSAATSGIVEQANQMKATSQAKLTPEKSSAKTTAQQINSIFSAAQNSINSHIGDGNAHVNTTSQEIQTITNHAIQLGQENQNALNVINEAKNLVNTYTEQIKAKQEEMQAKQKEQEAVGRQIEELGGQIEKTDINPATQASPQAVNGDNGDTPVSLPDEAPPTNGDGGEVKDAKPKKTNGSKKKPAASQPKQNAGSGNLEQLQAKYKSLGQEIKGISDSITQIQSNDITQQNTVIQENTSKYTANLSSIETDRSDMQTKKTEGEANLTKTKNDMQATAEKDAKELNTKATAENAKYSGNMLESQQDELTSTNLKAAADSADKNDANKPKLQQLSRDFKKLAKDFGDKNGVAKTNKTNFDNATANTNKLDQAFQQAVNGDFAKMNQSIYEAYNSAIQQTNIYAQNQLDGGESAPGGDIKSIKNADPGKGSFDASGLTSMGLNTIGNLINFDDSTTTGQVLNTVKDIGLQMLGSFI